jgi:hypothetical protein
MPICPAGHHSTATDFCDTCGLPMPAGSEQAEQPQQAAPSAEPLQPPAALICPTCGTPNVAEALFCEACGHDFIGGPPAPASQPSPTTPDAGPSPAADPATDAPMAISSPVSPAAPAVEWVGELWIDPDWYAAQGSSDPLPSPGLPDIVPLVKEANLIGRVSTSRNIFPEIDCELDTGCSRRHARLTTDGSRWWIEDLESANGTFVGSAAGPLPAMPIPRGKVELAPDQRIYVGAWTRIVIRRATEDEQAAFEPLLG